MGFLCQISEFHTTRIFSVLRLRYSPCGNRANSFKFFRFVPFFIKIKNRYAFRFGSTSNVYSKLDFWGNFMQYMRIVFGKGEAVRFSSAGVMR
jgi:hypothetical protein